MVWRRTLLCALSIAACRGEPDPLASALDALRDLAAQASVEATRLRRHLAARDDLGPGEYRNRLRGAGEAALRVLALLHQARAARVLARIAPAAGDERSRRRLVESSPASLAELATRPAAEWAALAAEHALRAERAAEALQSSVSEAVAELREMRARIADLRLRLARERFQIARAVAALGRGPLTAADLLPLARATRVRIAGVRQRAVARGPDAERHAVELSVQGRPSRVSAHAAALAAESGIEVVRAHVAGSGDALSARLEVVRRTLAREARPLPALAPSSTPSILLLRLRDAEAWRRTLDELAAPRPGPVPLFCAVLDSLPAGVRIQRLDVDADGFRLVAHAPGPLAGRLLARLGTRPELEIVSRLASGPRVSVHGRRAVGPPAPAPVTDASPQAPRPPPRASGAGAGLLTLSGVVSAASGSVRALLRDPDGRSHIVKVGDRLSGIEVVEIGKDYVVARAGTRAFRIVMP